MNNGTCYANGKHGTSYKNDRYDSRSFGYFLFAFFKRNPCQEKKEHNKQLQQLQDTVDGWNPTPPGTINNGKNYLSTGAGFQPSTVSPCHPCPSFGAWASTFGRRHGSSDSLWSLAFERTTSYDHGSVWLMVASYTGCFGDMMLLAVLHTCLNLCPRIWFNSFK